MPTPHEEFAHYYTEAIKAIKHEQETVPLLEQFAGAARGRNASAALESAPARMRLIDEYATVLTAVYQDVAADVPEPERGWRAAWKAFGRVEAFRFLLDNLLEGVKHDLSFDNMVADYERLQLVEKGERTIAEEKRNSPWWRNLGVGHLLKRIRKGLAKVANALVEIIINAMKAIPRFVSIKPSVGIAGAFPTVSFAFDLDIESMTIHDLFLALEGTLE